MESNHGLPEFGDGPEKGRPIFQVFYWNAHKIWLALVAIENRNEYARIRVHSNLQMCEQNDS